MRVDISSTTKYRARPQLSSATAAVKCGFRYPGQVSLTELEQYANALLREHNLHDWTFGYDRATRRAGQCDYTRRRITVSRRLMQLYSPHEARDVVIHEVAHALAGKEAGHGPVWREVALRLGGTARARISPQAPRLPARWKGVCQCGITFERMRRPAPNIVCRACVNAGAQGRISWSRTEEAAPTCLPEEARASAVDSPPDATSADVPAPAPVADPRVYQ